MQCVRLLQRSRCRNVLAAVCFSEAGVASRWLPGACFVCRACGRGFRAPFNGARGCATYRRRSGLRGYSYLRVRSTCPRGGTGCCCSVCASASAKQAPRRVGRHVLQRSRRHKSLASRCMFRVPSIREGCSWVRHVSPQKLIAWVLVSSRAWHLPTGRDWELLQRVRLLQRSRRRYVVASPGVFRVPSIPGRCSRAVSWSPEVRRKRGTVCCL